MRREYALRGITAHLLSISTYTAATNLNTCSGRSGLLQRWKQPFTTLQWPSTYTKY